MKTTDVNILKAMLENTQGNIPLDNGYTMTALLYHKIGGNYIPYVMGCTILGPRGCSYMLDCYGLEQIVKKFNIQIKQGINCKAICIKNGRTMQSICMEHIDSFVLAKTNEEAIKIAAKAVDMKYIARKDIEKFMEKLCRE